MSKQTFIDAKRKTLNNSVKLETSKNIFVCIYFKNKKSHIKNAMIMKISKQTNNLIINYYNNTVDFHNRLLRLCDYKGISVCN